MSDAGQVWVLIETDENGLLPHSRDLLSSVRALGLTPIAWTFAAEASSLVIPLSDYAVGEIRSVGVAESAMPGTALVTAMASCLALNDPPAAIVFSTSRDGREVAARLAARIDRPLLTNVRAIVSEATGLGAEQSIFGGSVTVRSRFTGAGPAMFTVRPGRGDMRTPGPPAKVVDATPPAGQPSDAQPRPRVIMRYEEDRPGVTLEEAAVVVAGGRGIQGPENYALVEELSSLLNGAAGATRAIVDLGWAPYASQVGQSGREVAPTVYLAFGISGAIQHIAGIRGAKNIVAINNDPAAPIFAVSDLGVVGDAVAILTRLIDVLRSGD